MHKKNSITKPCLNFHLLIHYLKKVITRNYNDFFAQPSYKSKRTLYQKYALLWLESWMSITIQGLKICESEMLNDFLRDTDAASKYYLQVDHKWVARGVQLILKDRNHSINL